MKRVSGRAGIAILLVIGLLAGMCLFLAEYVRSGESWVVFPGNPHAYSGTDLGCGVITDRNGEILMTSGVDKVYSGDAGIRKSTVHWLGDRSGNISTPALTYYAKNMLGYDILNGIYHYSDTGETSMLTISAEIQKVALEAMGSYRGTVAVYNYKTGEILCAVTTPNYDPDNVPENMEGQSKYEGVYMNRFTQAAYTPGSIFKVVTTAMALEALENPEELEFKCTKSYSMSGGKVTCEKKHGTLNLQEALTQSCNCYFAQLSEVLGEETVEKWLDRFQMAESVKFDGITTNSGKYAVSGATDAELAWSCIGQHKDLVNPCRFLQFMGIIAGGGSAAEPYIIQRAGSYWAVPSQTERLMREGTAQTLQEMMRSNVVNKYGADNFPGLTVCAKSGTAEVNGQRPNATFAGFVTDEAYPLAFVVFVEDAGRGANTCVPILSKVLAACKDSMDKE